ncbi:hypothetical protein GCM10023187_33150 [Nibrella viscosa]|uniref:CHRD domain-containing protein n=2 Tax=Nibrella viscosa TaxID=1084524 RepID=A0ABP8KLM7_9BACT
MVPALLALTLPFSSCENDKDPDKFNTLNFEAPLSARNMIPASSSSATGSFTGKYNKATRVLSYTVTTQGVTPTYIRIYRGAPGTIGPQEFVLSNSGNLTLTPAQENDLIFRNYYVQVGSANNPAGEIRGNIMQNRANPIE